jgi:TrmH family RNA methyltransferase
MITSTANQQVKQLIQLNKKAKLRDEKDVFVAEGTKMLGEAPADRIEKIYFSESYFRKLEKEKLPRGASYEIVQDQVFKAMCDTQTPQGVLCLVRQYHYTLEQLLKTERPLFLVLENLQDPGNLGTIMRTAEGAGVTGVILSKGSVDIYNPKTIRSTMGSIYRVPFLYADDLQQVLGVLKEHGICSYAAHLDGTHTYDREDYRGGSAFLIGNEGNGLSAELTACADTYIRIPMEGQLESLNAAVAAAILMYEAYRQRR